MQISSLRHFLAAVSQHSAARQTDGHAVVQGFIQRMITTAAMSRQQTGTGQPLVHAVMAEIGEVQQLQEQVDVPAIMQVSCVALLLDGLTRLPSHIPTELMKFIMPQAMREAGQHEAADRVSSWVSESYECTELQPALAVC